MSGTLQANNIITGTAKNVVVDDLATTSEVTTAINNRSGSAGAFSFRNYIVDGRFDYWYEGTTQTNSGYSSATMWCSISSYNTGFTKTVSRQSLIPEVDLPAIECPSATYFHRTVITDNLSTTSSYCTTYIGLENVRRLTGKTITLSFYARASTSGLKIVPDLFQIFGTDGSPQIDTPFGTISLTTSWVRYKKTITVPSIAGKVFGTTSDWIGVSFWVTAGSSSQWYNRAQQIGQQTGTFDIACVQLEEGSIATPFEELPEYIAKYMLNRYFVLDTINGGYIPGANGYTSRDRILNPNMRAVPSVTYGVSFNNTNNSWERFGEFLVNDFGLYTSNTTVDIDVSLLAFIRTESSADGNAIRCTFKADARF